MRLSYCLIIVIILWAACSCIGPKRFVKAAGKHPEWLNLLPQKIDTATSDTDTSHQAGFILKEIDTVTRTNTITQYLPYSGPVPKDCDSLDRHYRSQVNKLLYANHALATALTDIRAKVQGSLLIQDNSVLTFHLPQGIIRLYNRNGKTFIKATLKQAVAPIPEKRKSWFWEFIGTCVFSLFLAALLLKRK